MPIPKEPSVGTPADSRPSRPARTGQLERNVHLADKLRQAADLLAAQGANPFRVTAYRRPAESILALDRDIGEVAEQGREALERIPGIGPAIAGAIMQLLGTGRWMFLERLKGGAEPEQLFQVVPGIGPKLARRLHEALQVDTLEGLEIAAHEGRVERIPGIGKRRAAMLRGALSHVLSRVRPFPVRRPSEPDLATLLDVDREYREKAAAGALRRIAPRRFNPRGEAWLPILHTQRGDWHFTALYSNTALAHRLGRVNDWVVIYFHTDRQAEGQCTVVTETHGRLAGRRVVRGREAEFETRARLTA